MQSFYLIHPTFMVKARLGCLRSCGGSRNNFLRKVLSFDTLFAYLTFIKNDASLSQRIIGALPNEIHKMYLNEKEVIRKNTKTANNFQFREKGEQAKFKNKQPICWWKRNGESFAHRCS